MNLEDECLHLKEVEHVIGAGEPRFRREGSNTGPDHIPVPPRSGFARASRFSRREWCRVRAIARILIPSRCALRMCR